MARTKGLLDSPSKQLMQDLIRDLEQVRLHNSELKRVKQYERRSFYERLDQIVPEREEVLNAALRPPPLNSSSTTRGGGAYSSIYDPPPKKVAPRRGGGKRKKK
ncbi:hypothetical protein CISG_07373 [Coccidioides immitis RMSCC 3703]|uniref:Uncharacterized protein n=1 Tax=Coccidioides immitis RMSCC 3703 TaxID=454286 RepID=A0A0J8R285_COCIT|nr:hypothetical protein CISG_07373 [Coccidioides immitis RMSCC 3703]